MRRRDVQRELEYGDLWHLKHLIGIAFHEALGDPTRLGEIRAALERDAKKLQQAYDFEISFLRSLANEAREEARRWQARYEQARYGVRLRAQRIMDGWIKDQIRDGFDPNGFFVYLLWEEAEAPIYVGKSTNVCSRVGTHLSSRYGHRIQRVSLIRCPNAGQMDITELELIDLYQPELNRAGKRVQQLDPEDEFTARYGGAS